MENSLDFKSSVHLIEFNDKISTELKFTQKCIQLLEKYRKCFIDFKNRCICEQNIEINKDFSVLEEDYVNLIEGESTQKSKSLDLKTENIQNDGNNRSNESNGKVFDPMPELSDNWNESEENSEEEEEEDSQESDELFNPKSFGPKNKRSKTNCLKRLKKKYIYHNYVCDWIGCEKKYTKKDDLMAHISSCHTKEKPFRCDVCSKCFAIEKFLKNHQKLHPNSTVDKPKSTELSQNKCLICDLNDCGKVFNSMGNLKKHQSTVHSDERPYVCEWPGCSAAYKIKESLINHRAIHSDERQFKCDIEGCLKTFQTKWNYYSHMKAHRCLANPDKARKYPCDWPGCQFNGKNKQDLTIHMNRHMNIKPYKCPAVGCEMSYFTSYELKQHKIKVHEVVNESDREFRCHYDGCQKRYAVERDLKRHLRRHDRIYVCSWPECGQRYAAKQLLSDHMDRHMNVKSFHCHFIGCGKSFFSKTNYESHMKKIHKYNCNKNNRK